MNVAINQLRLKLQHELFDHLHDHRFWQRAKADHRIQAVAEFGCERPLNRGCIFACPCLTPKAQRVL